MDRSIPPLVRRMRCFWRSALSEYQYFEFQAVDRGLNKKEMAELRSFSTRDGFGVDFRSF
jgi:hypothetical protein